MKLDAHYRIGKQLRAAKPADKDARQKIASGSSVNTNDSNLQKTRQLADLLDDGSDQKPSDAVWQERRDLRVNGTGMPLSWSHVVVLVSAGSRTKLVQVAILAARRGWSAAQIRHHLQRDTGSFSRRPGTGQKVRKPTSLFEGLQQLQLDLEVVRKRVEVLRELAAATPGATAIINKLIVLAEAARALGDTDEVKRLIGSAGNPPHK